MFTGACEAVSYLGMRDLTAQGLAKNLDEALGRPVVQEGGRILARQLLRNTPDRSSVEGHGEIRWVVDCHAIVAPCKRRTQPVRLSEGTWSPGCFGIHDADMDSRFQQQDEVLHLLF